MFLICTYLNLKIYFAHSKIFIDFFVFCFFFIHVLTTKSCSLSIIIDDRIIKTREDWSALTRNENEEATGTVKRCNELSSNNRCSPVAMSPKYPSTTEQMSVFDKEIKTPSPFRFYVSTISNNYVRNVI